jgi:peroxiredoxin
LKRLKHLYIILIIFFLSLFTCPLVSAGDAQTGEQKKAIDFSFKNILDGQTVKLSDLRGKTVVLVFSSVYCKSCKKMMPGLNELYAKYKSSGLMILTLDIDKPPEEKAMHEFVTKWKIDFPFLVASREIAQQYGVVFLPTIFLIDENGIVVKKYLGPKKCDTIEKDIKAVKKQL